MKNKIEKLIDVKSIVTLILTLVFALQTVRGKLSPEQFQTVFTTVIAFYFGVQYQKNSREDQNNGNDSQK